MRCGGCGTLLQLLIPSFPTTFPLDGIQLLPVSIQQATERQIGSGIETQQATSPRYNAGSCSTYFGYVKALIDVNILFAGILAKQLELFCNWLGLFFAGCVGQRSFRGKIIIRREQPSRRTADVGNNGAYSIFGGFLGRDFAIELMSGLEGNYRGSITSHHWYQMLGCIVRVVAVI